MKMTRRIKTRIGRAAARGMTLIEIMIVVAIIGMLMGTVGVFAFGRLEKAKVTDTKLVIKTIEQALVHFQTDNTDSCPKSLSDLVTGKYLDKQPKDAYGQELIFKCPGDHNTDGADIISRGKDKQEGTADDIKSWEL
jgi:general secretion pathway protein G